MNTQTPGPIANGRDQAAVFAGTDVHFYAITTGGTSTNARGICSSKPPPTGPTLPSGYSAWAYLCSAKYSTGSSGVACQAEVSGNLEYQLEFNRPAEDGVDKYHLHIRCNAAWEFERQ